MIRIRPKHFRWAVLAVLLAGILGFRFIPGAGEVYSQTLYPAISTLLARASSFTSLLLEEIFVIGAALLLAVFPFTARRHKKKWTTVIGREIEIMAWIYIWFYWGWGMNYFRNSFFQRADVAAATYQENVFLRFLHAYTDSLNASFVPLSPSHRTEIHTYEQEVKNIYQSFPEHFGLRKPCAFQHPKQSLMDGLYSAVGVLGYMGPFFAESYVNPQMKADAFTYAHELSHWLGVSSEAEANFWAYQTCIRSSVPAVRYQGYSGLLPYILVNAASLLNENDFKKWTETIQPEVKEHYRQLHRYRQDLYNPFMGKIQDAVYNWYLKSNRIPSGQKNYAEVVGMILSMPEEWWY